MFAMLFPIKNVGLLGSASICKEISLQKEILVFAGKNARK
jgi:hypothetical protein